MASDATANYRRSTAGIAQRRKRRGRVGSGPWAQDLVWSDSYQQAAYALLTHLID